MRHLLQRGPRPTPRCDGTSTSGRLLVPHVARRLVVAAAAPPSKAANSPAAGRDGFVYLALELPPATNTRVKKSVFIKSSAKVGRRCDLPGVVTAECLR